MNGHGVMVEPERIAAVESILLLCWGLLGDVFIRVPLIEALRKKFPHARIVAVVDPAAVAVLENHPDCDEVIPFSRRKRPRWRYLVQTVSNLVELRRRRFDLCINLYCGGSSPRFSRIINADIRISFDHTAALRRANNVLVPHPSFAGNWTRAFATMLAPLGIAGQEVRRGTSFHCSEAAIAYAKGFVKDQPHPLAAFNLGAGASDKRWPVARFVEFARRIGDVYGVRPLVFTNPGMEELAEEFSRLYGADAIVAPLMSLDRVGALMAECDYVVTGDTSLMHLAFGLKKATLVLFTFTRPEMVAPEDVSFVSCFVESTTGESYCGKLAGSVDVPVDLAFEKFGELVRLAG